MAQGYDGVEGCGGHPEPAMGPGCLGWPPPPETGHPHPRRPEESSLDSLIFVVAGAPPPVGRGSVGIGARGGGRVHLDKPLRLEVVKGWWGWQQELPGKKWGQSPPPPPRDMGGKMYELAQTNLFTTERTKGGATHWRSVANCWHGLGLGGMEYAARAWTLNPTWSALMDMGGFNPDAANRGAYAELVHGSASRPKSKPKPAGTPATVGTPHPHPPNPRYAFANALGAISPTEDRQGTVCCLRSTIDLANCSSVDLATAVPPPVERR